MASALRPHPSSSMAEPIRWMLGIPLGAKASEPMSTLRSVAVISPSQADIEASWLRRSPLVAESPMSILLTTAGKLTPSIGNVLTPWSISAVAITTSTPREMALTAMAISRCAQASSSSSPRKTIPILLLNAARIPKSRSMAEPLLLMAMMARSNLFMATRTPSLSKTIRK